VTANRWPSERLKHIADVAFSSVDKKSVDGEVPVRLCNYTDVYYADEITADMPFMEATASLDQVRAFGLRAGDVLITKDSETADDIGVAAFVPERLDGVVCGYHLAVLRPKQDRVDPKYLFWSMASAYAREQMSVVASGVTRYGLRFGDVGNLRLLIPELDRQRAAARFLDRETARIDSLLKKKQALAAAIDVQMVTYITKMTERQEWSPIRLKYLLRERITDGPHETPEFEDEGVPFLSVDSVQDGRLVFDGCRYISPEANREYGRKCRPEKGDLLLTKAASIGKVAEVATDRVFAVWSPLALLKPDPSKASTRFLFFALQGRTAQEQMVLASTSNTQNNLSMPDIGRLKVQLPPLKEQARIARVLMGQWARRAQLLARLSASYKILSQRRQALVTSVVTGQIDVPAETA